MGSPDVDAERAPGASRQAIGNFDRTSTTFNTKIYSLKDAIAIEDTEVNQEAALQEQILCYLFAGEYAVTQHNLNAINSLNVAVKPL